MAVMLKRSDLLATGWTSALIRKLLGEPDEKESYQRGIYHVDRHWFAEERVQKAQESPEFLECQKRRKSRAAAPVARMQAYSRRYPTWRAALSDACHGLHSANRYTKHQTCSADNRTEIYALKNAFVELLYISGYCTSCHEHILVLPPKKCRDCGGTGDGYDGYCDRCGGTGNYLSEKRLRFYVFAFQVGGLRYCWHQPDRLVTFPVVTTEPPKEFDGVEREKPFGMSRSSLAAAKDLLRWVLQKAKEPEPVVKFSDAPIPLIEGKQEELFA